MTATSYIIHLGGRSYRVEVLDIDQGLARVRVNDTLYEVSVERHRPAQAAGEGSQPAIADRGELASAGPRPERPSGVDKVVEAPMPGDIVAVKVSPGDQVELGQELFVLEAMKMKSVIRAARSGVAESVHVQEGATVSYGEPLMTFM